VAGTPGARIVVEKPLEKLLALLPRLYPPELPAPGVAATARLGTGAELGKGIAIGEYAIIGQGVTLGDDVVIGPQSVVGAGVSIGRGSRLWPSVTIYSGATLGENVFYTGVARR
jgi:UDP-3-O-[3-hydroxymyristoyl] glucosamine N-acyltransferase